MHGIHIHALFDDLDLEVDFENVRKVVLLVIIVVIQRPFLIAPKTHTNYLDKSTLTLNRSCDRDRL